MRQKDRAEHDHRQAQTRQTSEKPHRESQTTKKLHESYRRTNDSGKWDAHPAKGAGNTGETKDKELLAAMSDKNYSGNHPQDGKAGIETPR